MSVPSWWRAFAIFQAVFTLAMGLGVALAPGMLLGILEVASSPGLVLLMRFFAMSLFFVSVVHFGARDTKEPAIARTIAAANLLEDGTLCVLTTLAVTGGVLGPMGWGLVVSFAGEVAANAVVWGKVRG